MAAIMPPRLRRRFAQNLNKPIVSNYHATQPQDHLSDR
jgi:hypothetical protein